MTRWARGEKSNRKREHEASSWQEFKSSYATVTSNARHTDHAAKHSYADRVTNKKRTNTARFRMEEKNDLKFFQDSKESDNIDNTIVFKSPTDERKPSIATELEKIGARHVHEISKPKILPVRKRSRPKHTHKSAKGLLKTELTEQLVKLKAEEKTLQENDVNEIEDEINKDQRRERRRLNRKDERMDSKMCFNCRKTGHTMQDCTENKGVEAADGVCYKCGSTEHSMQKCKAKVPPGHFPYAKCFICGEQGHLSSMCPDNPKGMYPKGGCCRICASVEHFKKDCPDLQKQSGVEEYVATTLLPCESVDDDSFVIQKSQIVTSVPKKRPKIVKF